MTSAFYEKNKTNIEIDTTTPKKPYHYHTLTGSFFNVPYLVVNDAKLYSNGRALNHHNGEIWVSDRKSSVDILDGLAGVHLLKRIGPKVAIDFNDMRVEAVN